MLEGKTLDLSTEKKKNTKALLSIESFLFNGESFYIIIVLL